MNKTTYYIIGAVAALWYFFRLNKASTSAKINLVNLKLKKSSGISLPTIVMDFSIQNPTNFPINALGIVGDVYLNGSFLSSVVNLNKVTIAARSETIYPVEVRTNIMDAITNISALIKDNKNIRVTAEMNVNIDNILYPFKVDRQIR